MMYLAGTNGVVVSLRPIRYQFPHTEKGNWDDLNWLVIAGEVESSDGSWTFQDPCLQTTEACRLGGWLREAADGSIAPGEPDEAGDISPDLGFIEPNIAFGLEARDGGDVSLRVYFSLESAPPWSGEERRTVSHRFFVRCWLSEDALRLSADDWMSALEGFPERGERYW